MHISQNSHLELSCRLWYLHRISPEGPTDIPGRHRGGEYIQVQHSLRFSIPLHVPRSPHACTSDRLQPVCAGHIHLLQRRLAGQDMGGQPSVSTRVNRYSEKLSYEIQ